MAIPGTVPVGGVLAPTAITDEYPVTDPSYAIDGLRNVNSFAERNAIPSLRRRAGMLVGITIGSPGETVYYKLLPEPWSYDDSDWIIFNSGSSEPAGNNTEIQFNNSGSFDADSRLTFDKITGIFKVDDFINFDAIINNITLLGYQAGKYNTGTDLNCIGAYAGYNNAANGANLIGSNAGYNNTGQYSIGIGWFALQNNNGINCIGIGVNAANRNTGQQFIGIGNEAGYYNTAYGALGIGYNAARSNKGVYASVFGFTAGRQNTGDYAILIGYESGINNTGDSVISIGRSASKYNTENNRLYIGDSSSATDESSGKTEVLLYGEFDNKILQINGLLRSIENIQIGDIDIATTPSDGMIRWNGTNYQGYKSSTWVNLDDSGSSQSTGTSISTDTVLDIIDMTVADGAKIYYTVKDATGSPLNMRAGEILVVWDATSGVYTANESQTIDTGDTSGIVIDFEINGSPGTIDVNAIITTGTWNVKVRREMI